MRRVFSIANPDSTVALHILRRPAQADRGIPFETTHRVVSIPLRGTAAYLTDPPVIRRILSHLRLPTEPPAVAPARPPPQMDFEF